MFKTTLSLSFIVATRFFGLFIILPVFSLKASELPGATEILVGLAIGIYALTQMLFQIPFGALSDKFGRKNTLFFGLLIFIVGSLISGFSQNIYMMIVGRFLQGCGAVGAVAIAMITDFVNEEERGKAMAIMGSMIGLSFTVSMIISPILSDKFGFFSLFHLSTLLTILCIVLLYSVVPKEITIKSRRKKIEFFDIVKNRDLTILNLTNCLQKMFMIVSFFLVPIMLDKMGLHEDKFWVVYLIAMIFSFLAMGMAGALGEKRGYSKHMLLGGVILFMVAYLMFEISFKFSLLSIFCVGVVIFFIGFSVHEPIMQSTASKFAKPIQKGEILGIFNSAGYFGSFCGAIFAPMFLKYLGEQSLAIFVIIICLLWFILLINLTNPAIFQNLYFDGLVDLSKLDNVDGIVEIYQKGEHQVVKFNAKMISKLKIKEIVGVNG